MHVVVTCYHIIACHTHHSYRRRILCLHLGDESVIRHSPCFTVTLHLELVFWVFCVLSSVSSEFCVLTRHVTTHSIRVELVLSAFWYCLWALRSQLHPSTLDQSTSSTRNYNMDIISTGTASIDLLFMTTEERTAHEASRCGRVTSPTRQPYHFGNSSLTPSLCHDGLASSYILDIFEHALLFCNTDSIVYIFTSQIISISLLPRPPRRQHHTRSEG
jgi:hypothetical protein